MKILLAFLLAVTAWAGAGSAGAAEAPCIRHSFHSNKADTADTTIIQPSNWNDCHVLETGTVIPDSSIPNLKDLTTGLTPGRCVQTDIVTGKLTATNDPCGTGTGTGGTGNINGFGTAGYLAIWTNTQTIGQATNIREQSNQLILGTGPTTVSFDVSLAPANVNTTIKVPNSATPVLVGAIPDPGSDNKCVSYIDYNGVQQRITCPGGGTVGPGTVDQLAIFNTTTTVNSTALFSVSGGVPAVGDISSKRYTISLSSAPAGLSTITAPNSATPVIVAGIADPSDSNCVKYIDTAGAQSRGPCGGAGTVSGLTTGRVTKAASSTSLADTIVEDCGSNVMSVGPCANAITGEMQAGKFSLTGGAGNAPTVSGQIQYDSTANRFKVGVNGSTKTLAHTDELGGGGGGLGDPSANGVVVRTSTNATTARTITGTANQITLSNGDGVSGNPTISIPASAQISIAKATNLTTNGFVKTGSSDGTLSVDTGTYTADPGGNGMMARTSSGTSTARTITGTSNQVTVTNGDGVSGNPTISIPSGAQLNVANLTNLTSNGFVKTGSGDGSLTVDTTTYTVDPGANGIVARTGSGTTSNRTITGTSNQISVADGNGVAGNPTLSIPSNAQISIAKATNLTTNGFVKTGSSDGTLSVDTTTYSTASSTDTFTNKTFNAESTGNVLALPVQRVYWAAGCNNATAGTMWDLPTATPAVAACVTGTNIQKGVLQFADTSGGFSAQMSDMLPADWTSTGGIDAKIIWTTSATTGNAKWALSTACTDIAASATDDPTFNTANTVTTAAPGTANRVQTSSITGLTTTGCTSATSMILHLKIFRDGNDASDTIAATANLIAVELTFRRSI